MPIKNIFLLFCMLASLPGFAQEVSLIEPTKTVVYESLSSTVNAVAFSPNGQYLLVGSTAPDPLLMNLDTRRVIYLRGHEGQINEVEFSPDGNFILTASNDKTAKLWNLNGIQLHSFPMEESVYSVAFSPDWSRDSLLITGSNKLSKMWRVNGTSLGALKEGNRHVFRLSFGANGNFFSAGRINRVPVVSPGNVSFSRKTLFALAPDGKSFLSGSSETIFKWNSNQNADPPEIYNPSSGNPSARQITLWNQNGGIEANFLIEGTPAYALTFTPDGKGFLVGVGNEIIHYNLEGEKIRAYRGHTKPVRCIAFTPDGRFFATGSADYTTRIWSLAEDQALATIACLKSNNWAVFDPAGLFDGSSGAMRNLYYQCSYENENLRLKLDQLKQRYYEPGLLTVLLGRSATDLRQVPNIQTIKLFPRVESEQVNNLMKFRLEARNGGLGKVSLYYNNVEIEEDINPSRLNELDFNFTDYLGGIITIGVYNEEGWLVSDFSPDSYYRYQVETPGVSSYSQIQPKMHVLSIGTSDYDGEQLDLAFADQDAQSMAMALASAGGRLFNTARGIETFCMTTTILDSLQMAKSSVKWGFASKPKIKARFDLIADSARTEDIVVLFFSGHGLSRNEGDKSMFYYLNQGVRSEEMLNDPNLREKYTISSDELTKWMGKIKALKKVLIVDACNAGQMIEDIAGVQTRSINPTQIRAFDRMKDRTGMYVLSGSAENKVSYEAAEFGHGLLTYALLNGMRGPATIRRYGGKQLIDVMNLFQYAADEVPLLANRIKGIQTPILGVPSNANSFDIGMVDETVDIPFASNKPVLQRSVFMHKNTFNDSLNLTDELELLFLKENNKGAQANYVYFDVNIYPNAYSFRGLYEVINGLIHINGKLSKNNTFIKDLYIPDSNNVKNLAKSINRALRDYFKSIERGN